MKDLQTIITSHALFQDMKPQHQALLASGAKEAKFKTGEVIFRQGDPANQFHLILSGKVLLEAHEPGDGTVPVQTLGPGDLLGWSWLFPPFAWNFQARAVEPTEVIALSGGHLLASAERDREFGYELMKRVAQVVIKRLQSTRKQLLERQIESALEG